MAAKLETVTLPVTGMTCAACQTHVERALRETPGVDQATVNLMTHNARIVFDPGIAAPQALIEAVREAGYDASLPSPDAAAARPEQDADASRSLRLRAIGAMTAGILIMLLSMPLGMGAHPGLFDRALMALAPWLYRIPARPLQFAMLAITAAGMFWAGRAIYRRAWIAARHRSSNMNTLVALGTGAAFFYSAVATLAPGYFLSHGIKPDVYYDSVLLILGFLLLGNWLDERAKHRTLDALEAFAKLQPTSARVIREGIETVVPIELIAAGDTIAVRPGERIPVDGIILGGSSTVDESLITGESVPVPRAPGDRLIGGSVNYEGALEYRATTIGAGSVLGQMLRLMEEAQSSKAPMQQLADRVSSVFVPVVLILAVLTFVLWIALGQGAGHAFAVAIAVLVIACPCAMGLAVPAALTVSIGRGAQLGVLFKGGESLERLARIDTVVFDKTGTLTLGKPEIVSAHPAPGVSEAELLQLAASVEQRSEHPLAHAVVTRAALVGATLLPAEDVSAIPGKGLRGIVQGHAVIAGNLAMMEAHAIHPADVSSEPGTTVLHVASDGRYLGALAARDTLRPGAADAIARLRSLGLAAVMLTGDSPQAAASIAQAVGIDQVVAGVLPDAKLAEIRRLQSTGRRVAMVGDGINDAAALAQADAGLAIGTGTDLAREAGDAILLRGEPQQIVDAILLARQTLRIMRQNLGWALGYNILGIPIAAGALYPLTGMLLSPAVAAAAMALSSVSVLSNSLRLRSFRPQ